jgi:hypothetical protein
MSAETAPALSADDAETQTSPETFQEAFKDARNAFYDLPFEPGFDELCAKRGINPEDTDKPRYWAAVSDFAHRSVAEQRQQGVPEEDLVVKELVASTTDYIYNQSFLDSGRGHQAGSQAANTARNVTSHYNNLIRDTATTFPNITATELATSMTQIANISIEHPAIKQNAAGILGNAVSGAQHELAFGQILDHTGRSYRTATNSEDLRGIDYVVESPNGTVDYIDVKASPHAIRARGSEAPFVRARDGQITMHSMLTDQELNDGFTISDDVAAQKAETVNRMLDMPEMPVYSASGH